MKPGTFQWLALMTGMMLIAGCGHNRSSSSSQSLPMTEPCSPSPQQPVVFYDETGTPSKMTPALSELELTRIIDVVAAQTEDPIWLIRVKPSIRSEARAGIVVYLRPQQQTPRIRMGYAYSISPFGEQINVPASWKYVQVSRSDQTFANQLTLPSASQLPFPWPNRTEPDSRNPVPMSKEEIVHIVDFVRQPSSYENAATEQSLPKQEMARSAQQLPILDIYRYGDTIQVMFGYRHSGLWGFRHTVTLECTPTNYRIVKWSTSVS
jgi:hypothetical protein